VVNIGTGVETSVNELYQAMASAAGVSDPPHYAPARPGELDRSALAIGRAARELGWAPAVDLATGTAATLEWFRARRR
jgi:UDP-glucose 4-epimerase